MKVKYQFCALILFFSMKGIAQVNSKVHIVEAHLNGDTLKILFRNKGNKSCLVPELSYRVGSDNKTMYDKYYKYSGDTIFMSLKKEVDRDLYTVNTSHKSSSVEGKLFYVDKKLLPQASYWTSVELNKPGNSKVLTLEFEQYRWICLID